MNTKIFALDLKRILRSPEVPMFVIGLPVVIYLIFGVAATYAKEMVADTTVNWAWVIMVNIAAYGAILSTASFAAGTSVEKIQGWGRQIALTPLSNGRYLGTKIALGALLAALPVAVIFLLGGLTQAKAEPSAWIISVLVILGGSLTFTLYGLAFGLLLHSDTAVSIASGLTTLFAFIANFFMPLGGWLLDFAKFMPGYGYGILARYAGTNGNQITMDGKPYTENLGIGIVNFVVWILIFALLALWGYQRSRRHA
ncbi:ABC transporter permease [Mobiluncus curtisii]|uniref:ABC-2 type transporter n=2 Tax=Mobiluncus curtisii TaxID=2051 RepID=D6ZJJ8_MOBCV|nr:ABC transporter permease [Mobiluncus curtisii]ADI66897.1 ABC-2 type transporter [Mobiluncus curtisii ATCC 43063]EFL93595.1 ABC-2 type transporter [Mobiluncus curtisii subsp. curtisii ATCC 35241]MCU9987252.1 ABC transporter permease [Mobiluncus curtisii]MCV0001191.1 ABC transporter permease [Mobiluncus curtisii]MCV0020268.1 ABC transporter permease [Mobiluncus curtisii]